MTLLLFFMCYLKTLMSRDMYIIMNTFYNICYYFFADFALKSSTFAKINN